MKIIAKKVKCKHLMPGDLFMIIDQKAIDMVLDYKDEEGNLTIGIQTFIRTNAPCPEEEKNDEIYRIRIQTK